MKKYIIAIGGAVIKTAKNELCELAEQGKIEMLIHNGGSLFHDFQTAIDYSMKDTSYPLKDLLEDYSCNKEASDLVWNWINGYSAPWGSITSLLEDTSIPVLMFTIMGADFWHLFNSKWGLVGTRMFEDFTKLVNRFKKENFHFINLGSAVIHPEVFIKAIAKAKPKNFKADVVDFLDMYRPRTRVAIYGKFYHMTHKEFLNKLLKGEIE